MLEHKFVWVEKFIELPHCRDFMQVEKFTACMMQHKFLYKVTLGACPKGCPMLTCT